jgi:hypothetical protein
VREADVEVRHRLGTLENVDESLVFWHPTAKATTVPTPLGRRTRSNNESALHRCLFLRSECRRWLAESARLDLRVEAQEEWLAEP